MKTPEILDIQVFGIVGHINEDQLSTITWMGDHTVHDSVHASGLHVILLLKKWIGMTLHAYSSLTILF